MGSLFKREREDRIDIFERCGGECAQLEKANFVRRQNIFIYSLSKSFICSTIARVENWQTKAAPFNSPSPIDICMWTFLPMGDVLCSCVERWVFGYLFVCLRLYMCVPYWWHFYLNFDMHNVRENRTSSTARFHPELVWVSPRNLVSFSWLRDEFKKKKEPNLWNTKEIFLQTRFDCVNPGFIIKSI